jgi:putative oxidoreductase
MSIFLLYSGYALFLFRIILGIIFFAHGIPKLRHLKANAAWFESVGFRPGWLSGTAAAILETAGGAAIIAGVFVQIAALLFAAEFAVILVWRLIRRDKFVGGAELDLMLFGSVVLLLTLVR